MSSENGNETPAPKRVLVLRQNPVAEGAPHWEEHAVEPSDGTLLVTLVRLRETEGVDLAFDYSCRQGKCGLCTVLVDGRPRLACTCRPCGEATRVEAVPSKPIIRDLVRRT